MAMKRITGATKGNKKVVRKSPRPAKKRAKTRGSVDMEAMQIRRMRMVGGLLTSVLIAVISTCGYLQGCEAEAFKAEAERNYLRALGIDTQRGDIYDRNGEALATSVEVDTVYANPREVTEPAEVAEQLSDILDIDVETLMRRLTGDGAFRYIKRQVTAEESERVRALKLDGIMISREAKRFYPKKELAGQLLGVVGFDSKGREGLESTYDETLRGGRVEASYHRNAQGGYAMIEALPPVETAAGNALRLTIDEKIQQVAERELERACLGSLALSGVATVMDVKTGDVLALAHFPRFNPNRYREQLAEDHAAREAGRRTVSRFRNRSITDQFEPGSIFKVFTLAAGIEEGIVSLDDRLDLENGRYRVGRKWISDTHRFKEPQTVRDVLKHSSNVGFIKIGQMLGRERLHQYLSEFGFGRTTGINLAGDASGLLRKPREWAEITLANIAFGQGVAVTALQTTAAMAAIGNGGVLMQPRVVSAQVAPDGRVLREFPPQRRGRVVSAGTARQVVDAMRGVTEFDGTGRLAWIYDYDVAGKTGTAQKPDMIAGGYAEDRWIASFLGLVPADRPTLAILVSIDEPQGQYYGGVVAAPAFKAIAEWTLNYLGVAPSYGSRERLVREPLVNHYGAPHVAAEGAYYDWPEDRQPGVDDEMPPQVTVPNFEGLPLREAVRAAHKAHLTVELDGSGVVSGQSLTSGTVVGPWARIGLYLTPAEGDLGDPDREPMGGAR